MPDAERLEYHRGEIRRLDAGDRSDEASNRLWYVHLHCVEALTERLRATERLEHWEAHLQDLKKKE